MEFLNQKIEIKKGSSSDNSHIMKELFESQGTGLGKIYEEINKNFSINRILEESEKDKRHFRPLDKVVNKTCSINK